MRITFSFFVLACFGVLFPAPLHAQTQAFTFERLTTRDGLPTNFVIDLIQDRQGFMWFATDNGLARYDGETFTYFRADPGDATSLGADLAEN